MMFGGPNLWHKRAGVAVGIALGFMALWAVSYPQRWGPDFERAYWQAGWRVLHNPGTLYDGYLGFVNMPIVAWLFAPFGWASSMGFIYTSRAIKLILLAGVLCLALIACLLGKLTDANRFVVWGLVFCNGPLVNSVKEGNLTHWVMVGLILFVLALQKRREVEAGAWLAICVVLKPVLLPMALWLATKGRWRAFLAFLGLVGGVSVLSVMLMGLPLHQAWLKAVSVGPIAAFNAQSISSLVARLWVGDSHLSIWYPVEGLPFMFHVLRWLGVLLAAVWALQRRDLSFGSALALTLLASPLSWTHYYAWLLIPLVMIKRFWMAALVGFPVVPVPWMMQLIGAVAMLRDSDARPPRADCGTAETGR